MKNGQTNVMIFGPTIGRAEDAYGGGVGGYTRKMSQYVNDLSLDGFRIVPVFHTVRGYAIKWFVLRMLVDLFRIVRGLIGIRPDVLHIVSQYRMATPRDYAAVALGKLFGAKVLFELEAGVFIQWYQSTNRLFRFLIRRSICRADRVICQGQPYVVFLAEEMGVDAHFFPNFVPDQEVPESVSSKLDGQSVRALFVGYAYRDKGIVEMVQGCQRAAEQGVQIDLTIVGKEADDMKKFLDSISPTPGLAISRVGILAHEDVLQQFEAHDVYLYPTYHPGEGHNNSINEAMMMGMVIISTKQGFLGTVLTDRSAYFLKSPDASDVADSMVWVDTHRPEAKSLATEARRRLAENFVSSVAFGRLENHYRSLTGLGRPDGVLNARPQSS